MHRAQGRHCASEWVAVHRVGGGAQERKGGGVQSEWRCTRAQGWRCTEWVAVHKSARVVYRVGGGAQESKGGTAHRVAVHREGDGAQSG